MVFSIFVDITSEITSVRQFVIGTSVGWDHYKLVFVKPGFNAVRDQQGIAYLVERFALAATRL